MEALPCPLPSLSPGPAAAGRQGAVRIHLEDRGQRVRVALRVPLSENTDDPWREWRPPELCDKEPRGQERCQEGPTWDPGRGKALLPGQWGHAPTTPSEGIGPRMRVFLVSHQPPEAQNPTVDN